MVVGIVGSEAAKFTPAGKERAIDRIWHILVRPGVTGVVSGACHLGGIDVWAAAQGKTLGIEVIEFPPKAHSWSNGYKPRNIQIAKTCDELWCITVKKLPDEYNGMIFPGCYHCGTTDHVKSGGCWTMRYAKKLGKQTKLVVIENS
jgi:hypothetical protein